MFNALSYTKKMKTLLLLTIMTLHALWGSACGMIDVNHNIQGKIIYSEALAMHPTARLKITLEDVSLADTSSKIIAQYNEVIAGDHTQYFIFNYNNAKILKNHRYALRATIRSNEGTLIWTTTQHYGWSSQRCEPYTLVLYPVAHKKTRYPLRAGVSLEYQCKDKAFSVKSGVGEVLLYLPTKKIILSQEHLNSSSKYIDGNGTLFYYKNQEADFRVDQHYYENCQRIK